MTTSVEYIRYRIPTGGGPAFEEAYRRAAVPLAAAPECVDFELTRCVEEPESYILRIRWTSVEAHLEGFRRGEHFGAFFAEIRPYVSAIEEMRHYEPTGVAGSGSSTPTIYAWAGGEEAFLRLAEVFYDRVLADPVLKPVFAEMSGDHPRHVALWLGEVFGGPARYSAERGGHAGMARHHVGRGITEEQRRRWVALLMDAADEAGLPSDPEFRAVFAYYIEWGTRMALIYSGDNPPPLNAAPMPRWEWGITPPWQPAKD
ncbi:group II truncated hemoglobin [Streptomyces litchfieldiae]|uniref:Antibiotic biosynthesis monooxygenase n=1 Tax=Streptomyces litchfieldiae TaxID=3075543 RepID=A0ABU2MSX1_9ACTN|nr:antibiotic biosynthesis monooxygenase [Streptomyces sp. DSM 44938]MDT0344635.1 antibiotic biosynthesis monooxygenase [Streptomyces sp. DSM 44938]